MRSPDMISSKLVQHGFAVAVVLLSTFLLGTLGDHINPTTMISSIPLILMEIKNKILVKIMRNDLGLKLVYRFEIQGFDHAVFLGNSSYHQKIVLINNCSESFKSVRHNYEI